jgi:hypothetical protein
MAEGYVKDECIGFVTKYLQRFDVVYRRVWDAEEEYGDVEEDSRGQEDHTCSQPHYGTLHTNMYCEMWESWNHGAGQF